jgi:protein-S-isoprenylcysteine O-methyltransferase Ste14
MEDLLKMGISACWWVLLAWWVVSAWGNKSAVRGEPWLTRVILYWVPLAIAFGLLGPGRWFRGTWLAEGIVPHTVPVFAASLVIAASGVGLACWARYLLGKNWSSVVQIKQGHELIEAGPYRYLRHPIYTGLLIAFIGTAIKVGDIRGIFSILIVFASFWRKLRMEERMLGDAFGEAYAAYRKRTHALIPGIL